MRYCAIFGIVFLVLATCNSGHCQGIPRFCPPCVPGVHLCPMNQPVPPAPITKTVQVDVPAPCTPPMRCIPSPVCSPYQGCPPSCPPPCPTRPVRVRVEVVVRPESPRPCMPQRYCCENPPVFEPIFYHAAWMLKSILCAPLSLGECMLGHGPIRQPLPPPIPVACIPCQVTPCPPPVPMCAPPVPPYNRPSSAGYQGHRLPRLPVVRHARLSGRFGVSRFFSDVATRYCPGTR